MTAVTIPPELAADVAAHPDRYRPDPRDPSRGLWNPTQILALAGDGAGQSGACNGLKTVGDVPVEAGFMGAAGSLVETPAWALVGSAEDGPRPEVGQRVLVLDAAEPEWELGWVGYAQSTAGPEAVPVTDPDDDSGWNGACPATRWALLPPDARDVALNEAADAMARESGYGGACADHQFQPPSPEEQERMREALRARRREARRDDAVDALVCLLGDVDDPATASPDVHRRAEAALVVGLASVQVAERESGQ